MNVVLFANTDWYLYNFRRSLALSLHNSGNRVLLISPPGAYGERLRELGLRWEPAPMRRRSLNPVREAALLVWLWRLLQVERVDVVHAFTLKCAVYGGLAARLAGVSARVLAVVGMGYTFANGSPLARVLRPLVRALVRLAAGGSAVRVIVQNRADAAELAENDIASQGTIRIVPGSGVNCERFAPTARHVSTATLRVLMPSRVLWDKGVSEFVQAARLLRSQGRALEFLLAGSPDPGNPASVPDTEIKSWMREGVVQWLGHVDDMPALFQSVNMVVLPSYREGLPRGLIEAAACALPIVTTDVPGCRDAVTHEVDGLLVPARNAEALAAAIARLHDAPQLRERLGKAARGKAEQYFDERRIIEQTLAVYRELIPGFSTGRHAFEPEAVPA